MAELETACCTPEAQARCCEPDQKAECCDSGGGCGCSAGTGATEREAVEPEALRETVRMRYAAAAKEPGACCGDGFGAALYSDTDGDDAPGTAVAASLGCGVPTEVADLHEGETVLDLGSGAGADVFISARRVGPSGRAIGLDMTDEMLELARRNAAEAGLSNVEFRKGYIEEIPLPDDAVDVVISNCVINLSADKSRVIREVARVLQPGGRFAVFDVIADSDIDDGTRADMAQWIGCIAGALTRDEYETHLRAAGLREIEIRETHRVHEHAGAAIIRARLPTTTCARSRSRVSRAG